MVLATEYLCSTALCSLSGKRSTIPLLALQAPAQISKGFFILSTMDNSTLQSILGSKTISFHAIFAKALGSVQAAVMLSQAFFWQEKAKFKDETLEINGQVYFKKKTDEWYDETGLTAEQQATARAKLQKVGAMVSKLAGVPACLYYRVDIDAIVLLIEQYLSENKKVFADKRTEKRDKKRSENGKFDKTSSGKEPNHSYGKIPELVNRILPQQVDGILPQLDTVKYRNINNDESLESLKGELKREVPFSENGKAAVTTYTPDQIENIAVAVVDFETLEAEKEPKANIPPAAGAPRKPRATKPAADRSAEIAEHLGTNELKTFFAAIHPEWAKWIAYKAVEKKGKYKAVETEAAAVAAFARKTGYDPAAAALAIEHSILGSYQGIYLPKSDNKPQSVPAPRYSFADSPQAHTPEQMLQEIRAFYTAHVDELQAIQATAGTAYKRERLTEVITAFCAHRVKIGKASESFERQNGALCSWLQEEKKRDAARVAGPGAQTVQYSTRAAAEIRYAKREEI